MKIEEVLKECPLYGHCWDNVRDMMIDEDKCKSGNLQTYLSCKRYDPFIAFRVIDIEKLKALGMEFV